jgi:hypothetical protein
VSAGAGNCESEDEVHRRAEGLQFLLRLVLWRVRDEMTIYLAHQPRFEEDEV